MATMVYKYTPIYIYVYDIDQNLITFDMYLGWVSMAANCCDIEV